MYTDILGGPKPSTELEFREARPQSLAFFLRGMVETEHIHTVRQDVLLFAGELGNLPPGHDALRAFYRQRIESALVTLQELVQQEHMALLIKVPAGQSTGARFTNVLREYSDGDESQSLPYRVLNIPTSRITAAKALPYPRKPGTDYYEPTITMRIISDSDKPATVYTAPGVVSELPSEGRWYNFNLSTCEFVLCPE